MAVLLDKDLHDDMLKLVRYKVLFVRRDYEVAFPEHEDLISDNLTADSFAAWKIAEFIQDLAAGTTPIPAKWRARRYPSGLTTGEFLRGIPEDDKKYLRVYYEVLDRYPRGKFNYEERQIGVLEQIRDRVGGVAAYQSGANDPFDEMLQQLELSSQTFLEWRKNFRRCAAGISRPLSSFFMKYKDIGSFLTPDISPEQIQQALTTTSSSAREALNGFAGSGDNVLEVLVRRTGMPPSDTQVPPNHSVRSQVVTSPRSGIRYWQKVVESYSQHIDPEDLAAVQQAVANKQADLHVHAYSDRSGLVTWSSLNQGAPIHMRGIGHAINGKILFFKQMLNADLSPITGPMPQAEFIQVVKDQFTVALDFELEESGKKSVCTCAMPVTFDFDKCDATFEGLVLKFRRDRIS